MRKIPAVPILLGLLLGCTSARQPGDTPRPVASPNVLTAVEINARQWTSAYAAVARLRPIMLQPRRGQVPRVFLDGRPARLDDLTLLPAEVIDEIRYVHGAEAVAFPGAAAAIVITTRSRPVSAH